VIHPVADNPQLPEPVARPPRPYSVGGISAGRDKQQTEHHKRSQDGLPRDFGRLFPPWANASDARHLRGVVPSGSLLDAAARSLNLHLASLPRRSGSIEFVQPGLETPTQPGVHGQWCMMEARDISAELDVGKRHSRLHTFLSCMQIAMATLVRSDERQPRFLLPQSSTNAPPCPRGSSRTRETRPFRLSKLIHSLNPRHCTPRFQ
jgi:hypothetical protein